MHRLLQENLVVWKDSPSRMPLILRGARQTGKTYLIEAFGQDEFDGVISINFEASPEFKNCFLDLNPKLILEQISALMRQTIVPGKHLLFLDEIQECPRAIQALRYFKEAYPALHVVAAGSLLEFTLNDAQFRMPVGRVEFLHLYPVNFSEFLLASGHRQLYEFIKNVDLTTQIPIAFHEKLLDLVNLYLYLGGMPAVLQAYLSGENILRCQELQAFLLNSYRNDFGKYASLINQKHCQHLFSKAPALIAKQFKYVDVDPDVQSRSLKVALQLLIQAGILLPIYATKANMLPLNAGVNEKAFKLLFLDVGLANHANAIDSLLLQEKQLTFKGVITEQFVGQELLAYAPSYEPAQLFFWKSEQRGATSEVDYILQVGTNIIPVEVKAGKLGKLKSLHQFMKLKQSRCAIKISRDPFQWDKHVLSLPLYMVSEWKRLVTMILNNE